MTQFIRNTHNNIISSTIIIYPNRPLYNEIGEIIKDTNSIK